MIRRATAHVLFATLMFAAPRSAVCETFETFSEPYRNLELAAAEAGVIAELQVREGDAIKAGEPAAILDREALLVAREIAETTLKCEGKIRYAAAECDLRRKRLEQLRQLRTQGHAGAEEVARAEAEFAAAEGQRLIAEEQQRLDRLELKKIEALIERRVIRSPITGIVTRLHHEQGELVTPAAPVVMTVAELQRLRLTFHLPLAAAAKLQTGTQLDVHFPDDAEAGPTSAKIEAVLPVVDSDSGTVRVKLLLENQNLQRRAGLRCTLTLDNAGDES